MLDYLNQIKNTLDMLAVVKKKRALDAMPESFQDVFLLLPILFHYHHPKLPGYTDRCVPQGITFYHPCDDILEKVTHDFGYVPEVLDESVCKISALYSMGSTCTLGQSIHSDLDIWVCVEHSLTADERLFLAQKCHLIEAWALSKGVRLTLFIVDADRFKDKHHECLMGENCGSAQHMLLLEEFYRSANHLAGKLLLWYAIPSNFIINGKQYTSYDECISALVEAKAIQRSQWIDFGSLINLSAQEYFGASLWQLYKSIDSPFKSVLKNLLLEAYSWEYPDNQVVAYQVKSSIQHYDMRFSYLDSYYMMLEKVTRYLIEIGDTVRLDLVRECFYLKVNEKLSQPVDSSSWRRLLLMELVNSWGWNDSYIKALDRCEMWKIEKVRDVNELLLQTMMAGYRNLLNFGRRNNLDSLMSPQDLAILTRKLYAAYEVLPGKVTVINPNIPGDLAEDNLTFIYVKNDRVNRIGWYVYKQKPTLDSIIGHQYLEYSHSLVKLVAWCYFNHLISAKTHFFYRDGLDHDATKLRQLVADLQSYFPISVPTATEEALSGPCEIRQLAIMVNLKDEVSADLDILNSYHQIFDVNVFNYGEKELSLVQSINLLYRNSWNEIRVLNFEGPSCVLDATKTLLNRMHKDADLPSPIKIFCYSKYLQNEILQQMQKLMDRCIDLRLTTSLNNVKQFMPLRINGSSWYLFFERFGVSAHQFDNTVDFYGALSNHKIHGSALNVWNTSNELPKEIDSFACEGIIQFFFENKLSGFDLYILNENNQAEIYRNCNGNVQNMIRDVNSFYALSDDRFTFATSLSVNFNLPQFYQIFYDENGERKIAPFNISSHN
ncbi:adenylate cyclase [Orbus hercynius]|uniref:Adenylate cyclase n=1 Tax=Orbus hercynius TaxID=593135 RepID=A0A495RJX6_9GAMM|nr:class I adenylate cyclase [Orbus hercynius]RKS87843.1 adenylate cyclase [Orbus hercynius]